MARNSLGFTLLELIVTLVIIAMITVLVGPRISANRPGLNLKTSAGHIASILRSASSKSVSESSDYCVALDLETKQVVFYKKSILENNQSIADYLEQMDSGGRESGSTEAKIQRYALPGIVQIEKIKPRDMNEPEVTEGWYEMHFFPNGTSNGGDIYLATGEDRKIVVRVAFITGVVTIEDEEE